jgi:hypothetical protein
VNKISALELLTTLINGFVPPHLVPLWTKDMKMVDFCLAIHFDKTFKRSSIICAIYVWKESNVTFFAVLSSDTFLRPSVVCHLQTCHRKHVYSLLTLRVGIGHIDVKYIFKVISWISRSLEMDKHMLFSEGEVKIIPLAPKICSQPACSHL